MTRRYYSSRKQPGALTFEDLCLKVQSLYFLLRDKAYFKGKAGITETVFPDGIEHEAAIALRFQPFPIAGWSAKKLTEDQVFETLEFLYDYVSKPGEWVPMTSETGYNYYDYDGYDEAAGRAEFREKANVFLADYKPGFELTEDGRVLALGTDGLQHILNEEIIPYDESNVDAKVRNAISKWRNRHSAPEDRKEAVRELADVFEWLKKTKRLATVLDGKDESAIFDLANNFAIRHHDPKQKAGYDQTIWYTWMFHFYLATYHAVIRSLIRHEKK